MTDFRRLSEDFWASPQIGLDDIAEAKARGFASIVNNRPEGEAPDQLPGGEIEAAGPVLAYCRSGTRSTLLWSLAQAAQGSDPDSIAAQAAGAGYDVAPIRPLLEMLGARSRS